MKTKEKELARFLGIKPSEVEINDGQYYKAEGIEYLVLTEEEADASARDYILDSLWAFNKSFIIEHSRVLDFDEASEKVVEAIQEQCESGNEAIKKLIDNLDEFVDDAISADGRGHFISSYDGEENESGEYLIYRIS